MNTKTLTALCLAALLGAICQPVAGSSLSFTTPVNCAEYQFVFSESIVLASLGDLLFEATGSGWQMLSIPSGWDQVRVSGNGTLYLYRNATHSVFHSTDGGATWSELAIEGFSNQDYIEMYPSPIPAMLFLSVQGAASTPSDEGIWKSVDGGATWRRVLYPQGALPTVLPIIFSPAFAQDGTMFASQTSRNTFVGIWKSTDFGQTWSPANNGLHVPAQFGNRAWLAISPQFTLDGTVFSGGGPLDRGFYKTYNRAVAWTYSGWLSPTSLALSPDYLADQTLLVADPGSGVYVSSDGGVTGQKVWANPDDPMLVGIRSANTPGRPDPNAKALEYWAVAKATRSGECYLYRSQDQGASWELQQLFQMPFALHLPLLAR